MKCSTQISLAEIFGHHVLVTRDVAIQICNCIQKTNCDTVTVDFSDIKFVSRSFADQFHKELLTLQAKSEKEIIVTNANREVNALLEAVSRTQSARHCDLGQIPVIQHTGRKQLREFLQSL